MSEYTVTLSKKCCLCGDFTIPLQYQDEEGHIYDADEGQIFCESCLRKLRKAIEETQFK